MLRLLQFALTEEDLFLFVLPVITNNRIIFQVAPHWQLALHIKFLHLSTYHTSSFVLSFLFALSSLLNYLGYYM